MLEVHIPDNLLVQASPDVLELLTLVELCWKWLMYPLFFEFRLK